MNTNSVPTELDDPIINLLPEKWRIWALVLVLISPYLTRAYHALANGGGIKGVFAAIWLGTNTPKPASTEPPKE